MFSIPKKLYNNLLKNGSKKYFCVSTDKAANPVNMMGASERIMEMYLMRKSEQIIISTARFANVAFSDGSLLHGFNQRILKKQPIVAPNDIKLICVKPKKKPNSVEDLMAQKKWPCLFTASDTTGEKDFEEFYTDNEILDIDCFENLGIIKNEAGFDQLKLENFKNQIGLSKSRF
ncbi:polysaccharide biosynthesis protein [Changchengzhania lutea]|uniref:polysaccharide biosynthesis protein n=1 Tax=Changchengzhania lutea TaxID=2049305 RepID=UPI001FE7D483|nr:polysaccharide biosynthesis protein [Changchengzhania lutea]